MPLVLDDNDSHTKIIKKIAPNSTILEFGPAHGVMSKYLFKVLNCEIYAVENDSIAAQAVSPFCKKVLIEDIESYTWEKEFKGMLFDHIILADVLEHLYDPWEVLKRVKCFLKSNGTVLISLPNIAHNSIIINLLKDKCEYRATGLLDNTHIRFFTKHSIDKMVHDCNYNIHSIDAVFCHPENTEFGNSYQEFNIGTVSTFLARNYGHVYQFVYEISQTSNHFQSSQLSLKEPNYIEIFYDTGSGYTTRECLKSYSLIEGIVNFPTNITIKSIRLDPSNRSGMIIKKDVVLKIEGLDGMIYDCQILDWIGFQEKNDGLMVCNGNDPQLILSVPTPNPVRLFYHLPYYSLYQAIDQLEIACIPSEDMTSKFILRDIQHNILSDVVADSEELKNDIFPLLVKIRLADGAAKIMSLESQLLEASGKIQSYSNFMDQLRAKKIVVFILKLFGITI